MKIFQRMEKSHEMKILGEWKIPTEWKNPTLWKNSRDEKPRGFLVIERPTLFDIKKSVFYKGMTHYQFWPWDIKGFPSELIRIWYLKSEDNLKVDNNALLTTLQRIKRRIIFGYALQISPWLKQMVILK